MGAGYSRMLAMVEDIPAKVPLYFWCAPAAAGQAADEFVLIDQTASVPVHGTEESIEELVLDALGRMQWCYIAVEVVDRRALERMYPAHARGGASSVQ